MYFEVNGQYHYDASRIRDAHNWCQNMTRQALAAGKRVVVSNTFTQLREMSRVFISMAMRALMQFQERSENAAAQAVRTWQVLSDADSTSNCYR